MSFTSGRVTSVRFHINGQGPLAVDQALLDKLSEFAFRETPIGAPEEVEAGWITGEHLLDTQFTYEKNGFGDAVLFAMRLDTNKVPADVRKAYRIINERAMADQNPSGFASRAQKKEAADLASRQAHEDLASGKFRKSKMIPMLWDLRRGMLHCGAAGTAVIEQLMMLFRKTFEMELVPVTAGSALGRILELKGRSRDYEDLRPTAFTPPPARTNDSEEAGYEGDPHLPVIPWAKQSLDLKDWVGNEFALWLWYLAANEEGLAEVSINGQSTELAFFIRDTLDMQCAWDATGKQMLKADGPSHLPEAAAAVREGKWPRRLGLMLSDVAAGDQGYYQLTLQADKFQITAAQLPAIEEIDSPREVIEQRILLVRQLSDMLDGLFERFGSVRTGTDWPKTREAMKQWIAELKVGKKAKTEAALAATP